MEEHYGGMFWSFCLAMHSLRCDATNAAMWKRKKICSTEADSFFVTEPIHYIGSFDSILAAIGLTSEIENTTTAFIVMAVAIVLSGLMMLLLADKISAFLAKNRMYEVLGLFILFIVGIMLVTEGGHLAHLKIFGNEIVPMSKTTFYFVIVVLIITDVVQGRYQKKLIAEQEKATTVTVEVSDKEV